MNYWQTPAIATSSVLEVSVSPSFPSRVNSRLLRRHDRRHPGAQTLSDELLTFISVARSLYADYGLVVLGVFSLCAVAAMFRVRGDAGAQRDKAQDGEEADKAPLKSDEPRVTRGYGTFEEQEEGGSGGQKENEEGLEDSGVDLEKYRVEETDGAEV